jgi:A/G-specific adenine glycosylase
MTDHLEIEDFSINIKAVKRFAKGLMHWHKTQNSRQMPWKGEPDPYKIWLSEVILQQTRVEQGMPYYLRFVEAFPRVEDLAAAPDEIVFKLWEGLGYYSRCRNLLQTARIITENYGGQFPDTYTELLRLKGIGPYTAAAIASFAFNEPRAVTDGNVVRVLARYHGIDTPFDTTAGKKLFGVLAQYSLQNNSPAAYNQAIMDFGALVCKPKLPICNTCPLKDSCTAYALQMQAKLPVKANRIEKRERFFAFYIMVWRQQVLVRQRVDSDIWQGLFVFDFDEIDDAAQLRKLSADQVLLQKNWNGVKAMPASAVFKQTLTHQHIYARFFEFHFSILPHDIPQGSRWVNKAEFDKIAFPRVIRTYLEERKQFLNNFFAFNLDKL